MKLTGATPMTIVLFEPKRFVSLYLTVGNWPLIVLNSSLPSEVSCVTKTIGGTRNNSETVAYSKIRKSADTKRSDTTRAFSFFRVLSTSPHSPKVLPQLFFRHSISGISNLASVVIYANVYPISRIDRPTVARSLNPYCVYCVLQILSKKRKVIVINVARDRFQHARKVDANAKVGIFRHHFTPNRVKRYPSPVRPATRLAIPLS